MLNVLVDSVQLIKEIKMKCPKCGQDTVIETERRPDGNSSCMCGFKGKTIDFIEIDNGSSNIKTLDKGDKYRKKVQSTTIDVYDVLMAFEVTNPAVQHAIKKLLAGGKRGHKDLMTDLEEAHWSIQRAIELEE